MVAEHFAVVGAIHDPRVVELVGLFELGEQVTDALVDQRHHGVVLAGAGEHELVGHHVALGVLAHEHEMLGPGLVLGRGLRRCGAFDLGAGVVVGPDRVADQRHVRLHERQVHHPRPVARLAADPLLGLVSQEAGEIEFLGQGRGDRVPVPVATPEVVPDHVAIGLERAVPVEEAHVRRQRVADVDVAVELLDDVIEPEAADELLARRRAAGLGGHRPRVEVGLSDRGRRVPGVLEAARERVPFRQAVAREVAEHAMVVGIAAGQHRGAGGLADRALGPCLVEADPLGRETVEVRRDDDLVARRPQHVGAVLIGVDEEEIGSLVAHRPTPSQEMIPCFSRMPLDL